MGIMYRSAGNPTEAIASFEKAMELDPRHQQSRYNKGRVLYDDMGFQDEAVKVWQELSKINPNYRIDNEGTTKTDFLKNR